MIIEEFDDGEEKGDDDADDWEDVAKVQIEEVVEGQVLDEEGVDVEFEDWVSANVES